MTSASASNKVKPPAAAAKDVAKAKDFSAMMMRVRAPMRAIHDSQVNHSYEWRRRQLLRLRAMVRDRRVEFLDALYQDLRKSEREAAVCEWCLVDKEITFALRNLRWWMSAKPVPSPGFLLPCFGYVQPRPLERPGCLVIAPFNYPFSLCLQPVVGSLAAGNPTVVKPSELCPATSRALREYVREYFGDGDDSDEPPALQVVEGSIPETTALLRLPWGKVFFTGSERVGRIVAAAAAKTLTPAVLELGGRCPCYVDETAPDDTFQMANRILYSKTMNCGQTCVAADYLLVHETVQERLCQALVRSFRVQLGEDPAQSELARIVSREHAQRLVDLIREVEEKTSRAIDNSDRPLNQNNNNTTILFGGSDQCDIDQRYVCPTAIVNPPPDSRLLAGGGEIFGPVLPVVVVSSREHAVREMKRLSGGATPLSLYVFTKSQAVFEEMSRAFPSAAAVRNDCVVHVASPFFGFGGLGSSGMGNYHGKHSFDAFSHPQFTMYRPCAPGLDWGMARFFPLDNVKGWILVHVLMAKLPAVPPLHTRKAFFLLVAVVACCYVPVLQVPVLLILHALAYVLEATAAALKKKT